PRERSRVNRREAEVFARKEMLEEGEKLLRAEPAGPFVVALVELAKGGYGNRAAQPAVVLRNRASRLPAVARIETYGPSRYRDAARRFNNLVDRELI
ncbi:MAG: hypothetical protein AB1425_16400, partial [Actinomycetota bacterium]